MTPFSHLCMNCMNPLSEDTAGLPCPVCGDRADEPNPPSFLQIGTVLSERYMVGRLQQAVGDAAVYAGFDTVLKAPITIREFWPQTLCDRNVDDSLRVIAGCEQTEAEYLNKFLTHARVVARMRDLPASIPIYDIFRENETAYTVSERCEGKTLAAVLEERGGRMSWDEARPLFIPLCASIISLHKAGVFHFGLTPECLVLADDGKLHIGDFAIPEARTSDSELSPDLHSGYSAPEQYSFGAHCGAETDVYGLAAVIFRTLVGNPPPDGEGRPQTNSDLTVSSEAAADLPSHVAAALFHALQPSTEKRIATIDELRDRLSEAPAVAALLDDEAGGEPLEEAEEEEEEAEEPRSRRTLFAVLLVIGFIIALILVAILVLNKLFPGRFSGNHGSDDPITQPTGTIVITDETKAHAANTILPVPDLLGRSYYELRGKFVEDRPVLLNGLQYSDSIPAGTIVSQTPSSEEKVDITEPVYVVISAGSEYVTIPDLTGWPLDHAMTLMEALGLQVQVDQVPISAQEAGNVDSSSPARGNSVARGSVIRLRVSSATTTEAPTTTTTEMSTTTTTVTTTAKPTTTTTAKPTTTTTKPVTTTAKPTTTTRTKKPTTEAPTETTVADPDETTVADPDVTTTDPDDGTDPTMAE